MLCWSFFLGTKGQSHVPTSLCGFFDGSLPANDVCGFSAFTYSELGMLKTVWDQRDEGCFGVQARLWKAHRCDAYHKVLSTW